MASKLVSIFADWSCCANNNTTVESLTSSIKSTIDLEKQHISSTSQSSIGSRSWRGRHCLPWPRLRYILFGVYQRLFTVVSSVNIALIVWICHKKSPLHSPTVLAIPVAANICLAVLIRQEHIINLLFRVLGCTPRAWPLQLRKFIAQLYHLGGIHSSCSVAALCWFLVFNIAVAKSRSKDKGDLAVYFLTLFLNVLLITITVTSIPSMRSRYHNPWEQVHRLAGWSILLLFWALFFTLSLTSQDIVHPKPLTFIVFSSPTFWLLLVSTVSVVLPWLNLRKVRCTPELLSSQAIRLHFSNHTLLPCTTPRIATSPLLQWHAFAAIPAQDNTKSYSVMIGNAGDWTSEIIKNPPTRIWTKGTPALGVLYMARIFRKVVLVATGSGIAPVSSLLTDARVEGRILWSARDPQVTFGQKVIATLQSRDQNARIIDTKINRRPNLVVEAQKMYTECQAEAVFVISNKSVTKKIVYELKRRDVPAFGPIFDS